MRRVLSFFLLLVVLVNSTGFTLNRHFCGETLAHTTLNDEVLPCCGDEEPDMPSDCCHDQSEVLALDHSQLDHQTLQIQPIALLTLYTIVYRGTFHSVISPASRGWTAFRSPPSPSTDVYLRVQSFLI